VIFFFVIVGQRAIAELDFLVRHSRESGNPATLLLHV
jgi:hypothetical protein